MASIGNHKFDIFQRNHGSLRSQTAYSCSPALYTKSSGTFLPNNLLNPFPTPLKDFYGKNTTL